ncbi:dihydrodipicolinate synthase family protein [Pelagicoccus enzymogenes]|uniref:dihydrodipicolinate synthase family protein n=1 Tax=Pelagicoccus enzymogenes TaxID=2773457 RepID=UPI0028102610|nr:dihydrodipicolinate synthase family protein [Pelagicoccus enzymogenes]MDQ8199416.1 dihydrodipicolinate synthase family protein [Pelagicoccus enzymogenes]
MFSGILPPLVTPLDEDQNVDREGLGTLVEHVLDGGVHGVFVLGTSGEGPALSLNQQKEVIRTVSMKVSRRVPVLVGITHSCYRESLRIAQCAADEGADAVVVAPQPYFGSQPSELIAYLKAMAKESPLPIVLYNIPANTQVPISWKTVELAAAIDGIVGFKDSSGDMVQLQKVRKAICAEKEFSIMVGPEELIAESVLMGGDGGIPGGANLFPALYTRLYDASVNQRFEEIRRLQGAVIEISRSLYEIDSSNMRIIRTIKAALAQMGVCKPIMSFPFGQFGPRENEILVERLESVISTVNEVLAETEYTVAEA